MSKKEVDFDKSINRPDREPKKGDPLRDPQKNPMKGKVKPSSETIHKLPQRQENKK